LDGFITQNFLGFGPSPTVEIDYSGPERRTVSVRGDSPGQTETLPLFSGTETISGQVGGESLKLNTQ
jgi:hypothetical protein